MGRMHYITVDEIDIIRSYGDLCDHLDKYWSHFCNEADAMKSMLAANWTKNEKEQLPYIAVRFQRVDKKLRPLANRLGLNYQDIVNSYVRAVYKSEYGMEGGKIQCE